VDDEAVGMAARQHIPQLLYDPIAGRVRRGIEMKDATPLMSVLST